MIADSFPKEKLGKALGVYQSGAFFGVGFALIFGGLAIQFAQTADNFGLPLVGEVKPWQLAFIAVGLPGVLVAAIMFLVKEPIRQGIASVEEDDISLGQAFRFAFRRWRVFIAHYTGFALLALPMTTLATWVPSYLIRVVGMTPPETGFKLGLIVLIFSPVGVIFGGALADSLFKKGYTDAALRVAVGAALFMIPVSFLATTMDSSASLALALACPFAFGASISMGLAPTALQLVTPNRLRGQIGAAWMLFLNIITAALGPWAVGVINDAWFGDPLAVGQSIAAVNTFAVLVGGIVLRLTWAPFRKAVEQQSID
jgi:MFS family permease